MAKYPTCYVCATELEDDIKSHGGNLYISCPMCGRYKIDRCVAEDMEGSYTHNKADKKIKISHCIRLRVDDDPNNWPIITRDNVVDALEIKLPSLKDKVQRLLLWLGRNEYTSPKVGEVTLSPFLARLCCQNVQDLQQVIHYATQEQLVKRHDFGQGSEGKFSLSLTSKGYNRYLELEQQLQSPIQEPAPSSSNGSTSQDYINQDRIQELRGIKHPDFDLKRLIRLCEELNIAYQNQCFISVALLQRCITNHVPPFFDKSCSSLKQVLSNCSLSKSCKELLDHLENGMRKVADEITHTPARQIESIPDSQQVSFAPHMNRLLEEVVRQFSPVPKV